MLRDPLRATDENGNRVITRTLCPLDHGTDDNGNPTPREAAAGLVLCRRHVGWLERDIAELAGLWDDLALRLHPSGSTLHPYTTRDAGGTATVNRRTGEEETATYVNGSVADLRTLIVSTLASWVMLVSEERGLVAPSTADPHALGGWLVRHIEWIAAQPFADEPAEHFRELSRQAFTLAYPSGRRRIEIAPHAGCTGTLVTTVSRTADLLPEAIWCDVCAHRIPPREWRQLRKTVTGEDVDPALTVAQACDLYGVPVRTMYRWVETGRVTDVGEAETRVLASAVEEVMHGMGVVRDSA